MKTIKLLVLFIFVFAGAAISQVIEEETSMSAGVHNAFVIDLYNANTKMAENVWKNYMKSFGKTKRDRKSKEWRSEAIVIPSVDPSYNVNLTGKFESLSNSSRAYVWLQMDDQFIDSDSHTNEARGVKVFLEDFAIEVEKAIVEEELDEEAKKLKDLSKDLEKLIKKNKGYHKDIEKAKEAILKAENAIQQNIKDQEMKRAEVQGQKEIMEMLPISLIPCHVFRSKPCHFPWS